MENDINWPTPAEWAAELRTTKKGQVRGRLCNGDNTANCCLGILAGVAGAEFNAPLAGFMVGDAMVSNTMGFGPRPDWMKNSIGRHAATLNDAHGKTFAEIADWIDAGMEVPES